MHGEWVRARKWWPPERGRLIRQVGRSTEGESGPTKQSGPGGQGPSTGRDSLTALGFRWALVSASWLPMYGLYMAGTIGFAVLCDRVLSAGVGRLASMALSVLATNGLIVAVTLVACRRTAAKVPTVRLDALRMRGRIPLLRVLFPTVLGTVGLAACVSIPLTWHLARTLEAAPSAPLELVPSGPTEWSTLALIVVALLGEECLLRFGLQRRLELVGPVLPAAVLTAGLSAMGHLYWWNMLLTLPLCCWLALCWWVRGNIWFTLSVHVAYNIDALRLAYRSTNPWAKLVESGWAIPAWILGLTLVLWSAARLVSARSMWSRDAAGASLVLE